MSDRVKSLKKEGSMSTNCWLLKAEPDSRIVKGVDVAFSAAIFEAKPDGVEHWDGVRNRQAKNFMKDEMKVGDPVLFYHSNTKIPGIAALAHVHKEGYPDFTAFDSTHPYYDPKSSEDEPTWYMVDLKFSSHLPNFVPLKLLQTLLTIPESDLPTYLTPEHLSAIRSMPLLAKGQRLSVQKVSSEAYEAVVLLGEKGGWEELMPVKGKKRVKAEESEETPVKKARAAKGKKAKAEESDENEAEEPEEVEEKAGKKQAKVPAEGSRRSSRTKA